jgi:poly-gamma-glutamate synthesis protein (capsule biosynthesis protein)
MNRRMLRAAMALLLMALSWALWQVPGPATAAVTDPQVHIVAMGDIMMGRNVGQTILNRADYNYPLAQVAPALRGADLSIANLEGPMSSTPPSFTSAYVHNNLILTSNIRAAPALRAAGLDVLSTANNHSFDAGASALATTRQALTDAGIMAVGSGPSQAVAQAPQYREVNGLRIALLARLGIQSNWRQDLIGQPNVEQPAYVNPASASSLAALRSDLQDARAHADLVILIMHWGVEYTVNVQDAQRRVANVAADEGVDLIVGAHPHVAEPVELLGSRPTLVTWSLGNAVFDQWFSNEVRQELALDAHFDRRGLVDLIVRPMWRQSVQPVFVSATDPQGRAVLTRIAPGSSAVLRAGGLQLQYTRPGTSSTAPARPALGIYANGEQ